MNPLVLITPQQRKSSRLLLAQRKALPKFKRSWSLSPHISSWTSLKGNMYAYCQLRMSHFTVSHGGLNDVKRHVSESVHQQRLKDLSSSSTIITFFRKDTGDHERKVIAAEVQMAQFIALHNISFQTADHLSDHFSRCPQIQR
jgi:hypothetical protein